MLIDKFSTLDTNRYKILSKGNTIEVYLIENGMLFQDKFFRMINIEKKTSIYAISRGSEQEIGVFQEETLAIAVLIILCYKNFERNQENSAIKRELRKVAEKNDIQRAIEIIKGECKDGFYSIFTLKENAICLIDNNGVYGVYYKNHYEIKEIINNVKLSKAFVATFNYANLLKCYDDIYKRIALSLSLNKEDYYKLIKFYML